MKKLNLILVAILALQVVILASQKFFGGVDYAPKTTVQGSKLFPDAKADTIVALEISQDGRTTQLKREGSEWKVVSEGNAAADNQAVLDAVAQLEKLAPGYIVSEKVEKHEQFEVAGKNAVSVKATNSAGIVVADFVLGKTTPDWRGVYLRVPADSRDVMKVDTSFRHNFVKNDTNPGAWRDKVVYKAEPKDVRKIEVALAAETIVFERKLSPSKEAGKENELVATDDDEWSITAPIQHPLDKYTGGSLARNIATLKCDGYVSDKSAADAGLEPPEAKVKATLADGSVLELELGKDDAGKTFARKPGGELLSIATYLVSNFKKKSTDWKPPAPAPDPATDAGAPPADDTTPPAPTGDGTSPPATGDGTSPPATGGG